MPWQGGVHNPEKHREEAVGASFRKRVVEVALEQWTQPHIQSDLKAWTDMPSRLQRQFHVTGTQYISTDKVQSQTLNTGGTAEDYFSPWANSPGRFLLYLLITANYLPSQSSGYSQSASLLAQQNQRSAILPHPVLANTQLRNLFVWCAFAGVV